MIIIEKLNTAKNYLNSIEYMCVYMFYQVIAEEMI